MNVKPSFHTASVGKYILPMNLLMVHVVRTEKFAPIGHGHVHIIGLDHAPKIQVWVAVSFLDRAFDCDSPDKIH